MRSVAISVVFSCPLQHHLGLLDDTSEECLRFLRPLLKILLVLRTTKAFQIDETRSVLPNFENVHRSHCVCESRFCGNVSSQREQLLLKLRHNLLHRHRHRSSSDRGSTSAPPAFYHTTSSNHRPADFTVHLRTRYLS